MYILRECHTFLSSQDPFLVGEYAVAWSLGFQTSPDAPYTLQASACCKHFVGNELEAWNGSTYVERYRVPLMNESLYARLHACAADTLSMP